MSKIFEALQNTDCRIRSFDIRGVLDDRITCDDIECADPPAMTVGDMPIVEGRPVIRDERPWAEHTRIASIRVRSRSPLAPFDGRHPAAGEQYRILRTRILQHSSQARVIAVSSAGTGDGKSITATNIAFALALCSDVKVLLVDADMRRGTIATELGLNPSPGLAEHLSGICDLNSVTIQCEQLPNLHIIPAGEEYANPCELLDSERWRSTCVSVREAYQFVILDSPPIGIVADYELLQNVADGVLLVLRPDNTNRQLAVRALQSIPKAKLIGVVLNCVSGWLMGEQNLYGSYYRK